MTTAFEIEGRDKQGPVRLRVEADNQFEGGGRWVRGTLHCHVDQMGSSPEVCDHHRKLGFTFLAATDYLNITPLPAASEEFITLPGAEMFYPGQTDLIHLICLGLSRSLRSGSR